MYREVHTHTQTHRTFTRLINQFALYIIMCNTFGHLKGGFKSLVVNIPGMTIPDRFQAVPLAPRLIF